jgi:glycosyltransferase involved in cell wall biosynthesis
MMSLLFVDSEQVWRGGQDQLFTLISGLAQRGHAIHLACHPESLLEKRVRSLGIVTHPIAVGNEISPLLFWRLLAVMRRVRPEIVGFNTPKPILLGNLAARFAGVRVRIIFRRVNFPLGRNPFTRLKYNWGIDCVVSISESIQHIVEKGGVSASKIRLVYEGLDLAGFPPRDFRRVRERGEPFVVGTISHLSPEKGQRYLVEAASLIPDVCRRMRFVIVGDGKCRAGLENQVTELGLQGCFHFAGFQDDTLKYLKSFDLLVLPSLSEGLSSAILSGMACSLPVIATQVGGIPELVHSGENGLLIPPANPTALARAIEYLAENFDEAAEMGRRGRRRMEESFTLERKIRETEELCAGLLKSHPPGLEFRL